MRGPIRVPSFQADTNLQDANLPNLGLRYDYIISFHVSHLLTDLVIALFSVLASASRLAFPFLSPWRSCLSLPHRSLFINNYIIHSSHAAGSKPYPHIILALEEYTQPQRFLDRPVRSFQYDFFWLFPRRLIDLPECSQRLFSLPPIT